ncbi:DUF3081 family protein [Endozoicomonas sp. SCSIO W0465]|uniref:DUF3081 family protein n=1 Tax=Endozoicomonas sp. SCSIO W0465 TaxID=2918516 RepID=UPI0020753F9B|nr:DUF3081 family protein [Endozoicomonas sp. SCSIO W0465]USE33935.1 DUF3081 domain-containing protein [Endozoicomonas sp. SCSIO W0465]
MEKHIDIQKCLLAFARILEKGEQVAEGYLLEGVTARSLDDGYTVILGNRECQLSIYFHNKFGIESASQKSTDAFIKLLYRIAEE